MPSSLDKYYKQIVWILIDKFKESPIKEVFDQFKAATSVKSLESKLFNDDFLTLVDLFGQKFERLQQISSLIDFHPAQRGFEEKDCYVNSITFEKYAQTMAKTDTIMKNVINSLKMLIVVKDSKATK